MCDIFTKDDVRQLFRKKSILFIGDSIMRNIYKDLVWLTSKSTRQSLIPQRHMKAKAEKNFLEDKIIIEADVHSGREYQEERDFYL